ncbi:MAG: IS1595 family transposase [Actinomycetota bacterium]
MPKTDRNNPTRGSASESRYSLMEFEREFPDDAACLEWLLQHRYPDGVYCPTCERVTRHHRERKRASYSCQFCGHRVHPQVGTIFENSATSLKLWFYAVYLMTSTRCGVSAKHLERELGVTYKTAWRMANKIRTLLEQGDEQLGGTVEVDESYFGGKDKWKHENKRPRLGPGGVSKTPVLGMVQRAASGEQGKVIAKVVGGTGKKHLMPTTKERILPSSTVYTDESYAYRDLGDLGYRHDRVNHAQGVYVSGNVHTNTIEGFWATVKRGIGGNYHAVSTKYLQSYLDEYAFRYNNRKAATRRGVFGVALSRIPQA